MDVKFGTWTVRSLCRTGSFKVVAGELGQYKLDIVVVQKFRWKKGGTEQAEDYTFFSGEGNHHHQLGSDFFVHKTIISVDRRTEFVSNRISYITLRGHWCSITVLNVHASCEDKSDDVKDSFFEELGCVFISFLGMI
jgi:hypothetical protein